MLKHLLLMILLWGAACQPTLVMDETLPTLADIATVTPLMIPTAVPTSIPRAIPSPMETSTPTVTPTATPITVTPTPTPSLTRTPFPMTASATFSPTVPLPSATVLPDTFTFGASVQGRELVGWRIGNGDQVILLVGGIHTGFEANTVRLIEELATHFRGKPQDVLPEITLVLIPALNPDGLVKGREVAGRFNANGVDLPRNWGCDWSPNAVWREGQAVDPGTRPFSEPETQALAALITDLRPGAVLFYHAAADGVFAGECAGDNSGAAALAAVYGEAAGYPFGEPFSDYPLTGTATNWVVELGIPALAVELATSTGAEFVRNWRGVMAIQRWLATGSE